MSKLAVLLHYHDLRTSDHPGLTAMANEGSKILPLFIYDQKNLRRLGGASKWWLNYALLRLINEYKNLGHCLQLVKDDTLNVIQDLVTSNKESDVSFHISYDPDPKHRNLVKQIRDLGFDLKIYNSNYFFETGTVLNQQGNPYQVFTPFYKALKQRVDEWLSECETLDNAYDFSDYQIYNSVDLAQLELLPNNDWDSGMQNYWEPPRTAKWYWKRFLNHVENYGSLRDIPGKFGTSHLSPYLAWGELSTRQLYASLQRRSLLDKSEQWVRQLVWREFSANLLHHFPHLVDRPLRPEFERFPTRQQREDYDSWKQGKTGFPIVDAGMRQLWSTGWMHNRVRMITASFLVKQLLLPWQWGAEWFEDTLVDFDLSNNLMGWQWSAGCGADAAPYFRIFNPLLQSKKFDKDGSYIREWIPALKDLKGGLVHEPEKAGLISSKLDYPDPMLDLKETRQRALDAYQQMRELR
ncbi:MAG: deoxyribodipyrimidine photo-lyase [bacterium]|nr:deoxyribodipyrimidine photo-lyase [bacterium]